MDIEEIKGLVYSEEYDDILLNEDGEIFKGEPWISLENEVKEGVEVAHELACKVLEHISLSYPGIMPRKLIEIWGALKDNAEVTEAFINEAVNYYLITSDVADFLLDENDPMRKLGHSLILQDCDDSCDKFEDFAVMVSNAAYYEGSFEEDEDSIATILLSLFNEVENMPYASKLQDEFITDLSFGS